MVFKKGHSSWKGKTLSEEHKQHLSESHKGKATWNKGKKTGQIPWNKSMQYPTELKKKIAIATRKAMRAPNIKEKIRARPPRRGDKCPAWKGGISFIEYPQEFNKILKEHIRQRDRFRCQECFRHQEELGYNLHVHHIDFNKRNNTSKNLISLCRSCHMQTNFDREEWTKYYQDKIIEVLNDG